MIPVVAIVGRPNVGKSSLLNAIAGSRVSIVSPVEGVTRDRVAVEVAHEGRTFELVDTGGIGIVDADRLEESVEEQIAFAISAADLVVFLVDIRRGLTPSDREIARRLRREGKPVVLAANKAESRTLQMDVFEFCALGFDEPLAISAKERMNVFDLLDRIVERLPEGEPSREAEGVRMAVVGKRNAGKSTLINALARAPRVIVSQVPGTTRDSVDVRFEIDGRTYVAIDTAGMRRGKSLGDPVDFYSQHRTLRSIRRAHVVLFLIDATEELSQVDKKIAALVDQHCKPCVLGINKWDLVEGAGPGEYERYLRANLPSLSFAPISYLSAKEDRNVRATVEALERLFDQAGSRVSTADLNRALAAAFERRRPHTRTSKEAKLFYGTQTGVHPPTILLFVNEPKLFDMEYRRYLKSYLRRVFPFREIPVRLRFRGKSGAGARFPEEGPAARDR